MSPQEAVEVLRQASAMAMMSLSDHQKTLQAVQVLQQFTSPPPEPVDEEPKKKK